MTDPRELTIPHDDPRLDSDAETEALLREYPTIHVTGPDGRVFVTISSLNLCPCCGQPTAA